MEINILFIPEHIPGYTGHVTGIETSQPTGHDIFGTSYAKATSQAIKGNITDFLVGPDEDMDMVGRQRGVNYEVLRWGW